MFTPDTGYSAPIHDLTRYLVAKGSYDTSNSRTRSGVRLVVTNGECCGGPVFGV